MSARVSSLYYCLFVCSFEGFEVAFESHVVPLLGGPSDVTKPKRRSYRSRAGPRGTATKVEPASQEELRSAAVLHESD